MAILAFSLVEVNIFESFGLRIPLNGTPFTLNPKPQTPKPKP